MILLVRYTDGSSAEMYDVRQIRFEDGRLVVVRERHVQRVPIDTVIEFALHV